MANGKITTEPSSLTALDHNESPAFRYSRLIEARRVLRDQADVKMSGLAMLSASWLLEELQMNKRTWRQMRNGSGYLETANEVKEDGNTA
jgi:hypothetical protein